MASVLTIAGTAVDRAASRCKLDRWSDSIDEYPTLEWHQVATALPGSWHPGQAVTLTVDGTPRFAGQLVSVHPSFGPAGWTIGYRALGLRYLANLIPVTNPADGTGTIVYNLPVTDPDYLATNSGLSVGEILTRVLDAHATALTAAGVGTYTLAELTALTLVPPEPVTFAGCHLWNAIEMFLEKEAGMVCCYVEPSGAIRVRNVADFTAATLTMGSDPIEPPALDRDTEGCFTRVVIRGRAQVEGGLLSKVQASLTPAWTSTDQTNWKWSDFSQPGGGTDSGSVTSLSSTTATLQSDDNTKTWATNYWNGIEGTIALINPVATGITYTETRRITATSALTAGGTATVTFDVPLANSGYTKYRILGQPTATSRVDVWRRYNIVPTWIAQHLVAGPFPYPVPFATATTVEMVSYKQSMVFNGLVGFPWPFEVDQVNGQIRFLEPVVKLTTTQANLDAGGASVTAPSEILVLVPYSRGVLTATAPADVAGVPRYQGTASTVDGVQRTWTIDLPSWIDARDQASLAALAQVYLDTVKDSVVTGTVTCYGKLTSVLDLGYCLNVAGDNGSAYTTGWESLNATVRGITLEWPPEGDANVYRTHLHVSTRRKAATGERVYLHPAWQSSVPWDGMGFAADDFSALVPPGSGPTPGIGTGVDLDLSLNPHLAPPAAESESPGPREADPGARPEPEAIDPGPSAMPEMPRTGPPPSANPFRDDPGGTGPPPAWNPFAE